MSERDKNGRPVIFNQAAIDNTEVHDTAENALVLAPKRPSHGLQGSSVDLCANYFRITEIPNTKNLFLYNITIVTSGARESPKGRKLQQIIRIMLETQPVFSRRKNTFSTDFAQMLVSKTRLEDELQELEFNVEWRKELEDPPEPLPPPPTYHVLLEPHIIGSVNVGQVWNTLITNGVPVTQLDFPDQPPLMQALNIMKSHHSKMSHLIANVGRNKSFLMDSSGPRDLQVPLRKAISRALEVRRGYYSSARVAEGDLLLNVNPTASLFHRSETEKGEPMALSELIAVRAQELGIQNFDKEHDCRWLKDVIKGMRVRRGDVATRFNEVGQEIPDARVVFGLADTRNKDKQRETTQIFGSLAYMTYCWKEDAYHKGAAVKQPVVNLGNREHPDYFLTSMCIVLPGNLSRAKLVDKAQQKTMIDFAVLTPQNAKTAIEKRALNTLGLDSIVDRSSIPMAVSPKMIELQGWRLPMPPVTYQTLVKRRDVSSGGWSLEGLKFHKPKYLDNWVVVWFRSKASKKSDYDLSLATTNFSADLKRHGLSVGTPKPTRIVTIQNHSDPIIGTELANISKLSYTFAVVVLPRFDDKLYKRIKTAGDILGGFHTAGVIEDKFMGKGSNDMQYFSNVALKINLKLSGANQIANDRDLPLVSEGKTMVVSYDVTHPPPAPKSIPSDGKQAATERKDTSKAPPPSGSKDTSKAKNTKPGPKYNPTGLKVFDDPQSRACSIAAMVASIDKNLAQFPAVIRMQEKAGQEMVIKLQEMLETRLDLWAKHHSGQYPEKIIVYRDGVSESQYKAVLVEELPLLEAACIKKCGKEPRKITLMVVGKRHHTRFLRKTTNGVDNPFFGTVVDSTITHDAIWDFFLQSHQPLVGVAKPAHYIVLKDDIFRSYYGDIRAVSILETLTNTMCHLNGRSTKPGGMVAAAWYADLACDRARCYVERHNQLNPGVQLQQSNLELHVKLKDAMFYI